MVTDICNSILAIVLAIPFLVTFLIVMSIVRKNTRPLKSVRVGGFGPMLNPMSLGKTVLELLANFRFSSDLA